MKNIFLKQLMILSLIIVMATTTHALLVDTHKAINTYIAQNSLNGFSLDTYSKSELGLQSGIEEKFKNLMLWEWLRDGGEYEDVPYRWMPYLRSVNHFHNPLTDQGFSGIWGTDFLYGVSATQWSQWPLGAQTVQVLGSGNYSWYDVRDYYYNALTLTNKTDRETNFAETFRGLGQLMHLVEDMSVPEHTRDDGHYILYDYEQWVRDEIKTYSQLSQYALFYFFDSSAIGNPNPLAPVPFANLFDTNQYDGTYPNRTLQSNIGLSEYTNTNFFSEGKLC
ncbi:MAG: hypothetical protein HZC48_00105 [Nitrospirae bacterium]|nr:hypothetical protein [Nitrospirota bacterium]